MSAQDIQKAFDEKAFGKPVIVPRFFEHAKKNTTKSSGYGINIYDTSTYVEIRTKGRKDTTTRKATKEDTELFEHAYSKYAKQHSDNKLPLEALAGYTTANRFILRDLNVSDAEELAEYKGLLPLGSLKLMRHNAKHMLEWLKAYEPPYFEDDALPETDDGSTGNQAQWQVLQGGDGFTPSDGQGGNNGASLQRLGVTLDEDGNIIEFNGQAVSATQTRTQSHQKEVKKEVKKVVSFY